MAVKKLKKNARVPRKHQHSRTVEKVVKNHEPVKKLKNRKAMVIAQEIKFARLLANNDKTIRDKMLKNLKKWLTVRSESSFAFTEADFMRLWKGLFYCMWMSDKPLIQEELAESLSNIVHCFDSMDTALLYTKCTLNTLAVEWFGIDQYRLDKFQMLARRIIRQTFEMCRRKSWKEDLVKGVASVIETVLLDPKSTLGFTLHITELYMEELAKIGGGNIPPNIVTELIRPFAIHLATMEDERQIRHVVKHIFRYLMFQSDVGLDYMEKFAAWREAGFPCGSIDAMQKIELSDDGSEAEDESEEVENNVETKPTASPLDPRAGNVDVELPQLPFDPTEIAQLIKQYKFHPKSTTKTRRQIMRLIREFIELAQGSMPIGVKEIDLPQLKKSETDPKKAAYRLIEFEKDLYSDTIRRKRKRKHGASVDEDDEGFENILMPINAEELNENGFKEAKIISDDQSDSEDEDAAPNEAVNAETFHISSKKSKKKASKKFAESTVTSSNETSTKAEQKKQKKRKIVSKKMVDADGASVIDKRVDKQQSLPQKNVKVKSKKSKTKKLQNAINFVSQKLLNRSLDDGIPVKTKKSRLSLDCAWDVSNNEDLPALAVTSKTKVAAKTNDAEKQTVVVEKKVSTITETKNQLEKIPWLLPVLTKLEDQKPKNQTPTKCIPEAQCGSSGKKRVKIMLRRNTAQHTSEYMRQLRQCPAIPYDANRKPPAGVLKPSALSSPVNPFYKKNCT